MDIENRFIYFQTDTGDMVYDTEGIGSFLIMNGSLTERTSKVDFTNSLLHNVGINYITTYGMNITYNDTTISSYYY